ncbi:MAG: TonB-dependent receptor [Acidobacteriota bacterium]|nr:TonB-dependent receptor [Acidobacteriota bacterium]
MSRHLCTLTLLLCAAVPATLLAQSEVGGASLGGTVTDSSSALVAGAAVTLTSPDTGFSRATVTNDSGVYSFPRLPVGTYNLKVEHAGFRTTNQQGLRLDVGAVATVNIGLQVGATAEVITVNADAPLIEAERTQTATTVNEKAVENLPVNGRNFINFVTLTPGVVTDPTRGGDLSFGGQRGPANSLLVDGGSSDNLFYGQAVGRTGFRPYAFSEDAVQEFQVNTNSYPAEIGRAGGGVINVVTKSGTNQVHGSAFEFYRDRALNANTFTNNRANTDLGTASYIPRQPYHFNQFGGSLGGPVVKDKVFFFVNYDGQRNTAPQLITPSIPVPAASLPALGQYLAPYTTGANNDVALAKVDWNIGNTQRLSVRYNLNRFTGKNFEAFSGSSALEHTGDSQVNTDNIAVNYSKTYGAATVLDLRYVYVRDNEPGFANTDKPETAISSGVTFGRNNFSPRFANDKTNNIIGSVSIVRGLHTLKFGADVNVEKIANFFPGYFSGSYSFPSYAAFAAGTATSFTQAFAGPGTTGATTYPNVNEYAFYAQDAWRVSSQLTVDLGVRYDLFSYAQGSIRNQDAGLLAAGFKTDVVPVDHNNIAPRVGFAYRPIANSDRIVVRGGYGIFYARTPAILINTALAQNGIQVRTYTIFPGNALFPTYPNVLTTAPPAGAPPSINVMDPHFASAATQQYSFNVEMAPMKNLAVNVGYLGVHGEHLTRTRDINLFPAVPVSAVLPDGTGVTYYRHPGGTSPARPNANFGRISLFDSGADSVYNSAFIQVTKRLADRFQFLTSYTFAKVLDDVPEQTSVVVGSDDSKIAQDTLNPNLDRGRGNSDIRHRFVFSGVWDIDYASRMSNKVARYVLGGWQLSSIAQIQSGRPFSQLVNTTGGGIDLNNDGNSAVDRVPSVGRNTLTGPNFENVDVRVTKEIPVYGERVRVRLIAEAFNATNRANFNNIQNSRYAFNSITNTFTNRTDYLRTLTTFDPRILQLAVKILF